MNPQQEDFVQLRRLLALKRHEKPPPGYFDSFSRQVMVQIAAGEQVRDYSLWEALSWEAPWLQRLWSLVETRPIFAGSFGVAVCGVLLTGVLLAERTDATMVSNPGSAPVVAEQQTAKVELPAAFSTISGLDGPADSFFKRKQAGYADPVLFTAPVAK